MQGAMVTNSNWYVAITNPNCHRRAEAGLAELGYRAFWPKYRKWASHARVKVAKEYPILGRYLFVEIPDHNFWAVRNINGIEALLTGDNGAPAIVADSQVWAFRERYMAGEWDFVSQERIPTGARIKIMEGEFADMLAVIRRRHRGKLEFVIGGKFYYTNESNVRAA
ncbi:transcription termination/antitermination NusG family protein [Bradyrhizobium sp. JR18.2]|uniref:transcription termination/antitermination NusG family protein n=1 Tax=Bradyrhizobium sp. JR18.2 TaxID=3156369 RepID=UPI003393C885